VKTNLWIIAVSVTVILMVSIQGLNENRIEKKKVEIAQLEEHIEELYIMEAERITKLQEETLTLTPPMRVYVLTSECGIRKDPMGGGTEKVHKGIDIVGPEDATVEAAAIGTVVEAWSAPDGYYQGDPVYGGKVVIDHGGGVSTLYGHMSKLLVKEGDYVKRGQPIGIQGSTGMSVGDHLHFEVIYDPILALEMGIRRRSE